MDSSPRVHIDLPRGPLRAKRTATLKTVDKALNAVDLLAVFGGKVGVRELAEYLGTDKSSTHRLLTTLERHGYVAQDSITGKYQLGMRVFEVGSVLLNQMNLRAVAHVHLERLARDTREGAHLAVENADQCAYVDKIEGEDARPTSSQLGWRQPLHCTALGKVLLAYLPDGRMQRILSAEEPKPLTPYTVTDPDQLRAQLSEVRRTGVALDNQEIEVGQFCVAAPVFGADGQVVAAISIAGPVERFGPERLPQLVQSVRHCAESISSDLARSSGQSLPGPAARQTGTAASAGRDSIDSPAFPKNIDTNTKNSSCLGRNPVL